MQRALPPRGLPPARAAPVPAAMERVWGPLTVPGLQGAPALPAARAP